jgi:hypothetical protein
MSSLVLMVAVLIGTAVLLLTVIGAIAYARRRP